MSLNRYPRSISISTDIIKSTTEKAHIGCLDNNSAKRIATNKVGEAGTKLLDKTDEESLTTFTCSFVSHSIIAHNYFTIVFSFLIRHPWDRAVLY